MAKGVADAMAFVRRARASKAMTSAAERYGKGRMGGIAGRSAGFVRRHPYVSAGVGGGLALNARAMYRRTPGPQRSSRNQNNMFLRRMRSSATTGLPGKSIGGFTGY